MWLGTGDSQKIALLVLGVVWFLMTLFMESWERSQNRAAVFLLVALK